MPTIAELLRTRLTERGAQKRLAITLGVEQSTVSQWVNSRSEPTADRWEAIEDALGLDRHAIAMAKGDIPGRHALPRDEASALLRDLSEIVADLRSTIASMDARLSAIEESR